MSVSAGPTQTKPTRLSTTSRIGDVLRQRIEAGEWPVGKRLPSEPDLARELEASRGSLRSALAALENEGLLQRRHGSGTYVAQPRQLVSSLHVNKSADQMISETGRTPGTSELAWRRLRASTDVCTRLNIPDGSEVFELFRVRTADGRPVTVSFDYVSTATIPDQPALLGPSFYTFLADVCGVRIRYGVAELIPATADAAIAAHLGTAQGALCLLLRQVDFDEGNKPISYSVEYHLADAFRFELLRSGPNASADATG